MFRDDQDINAIRMKKFHNPLSDHAIMSTASSTFCSQSLFSGTLTNVIYFITLSLYIIVFSSWRHHCWYLSIFEWSSIMISNEVCHIPRISNVIHLLRMLFLIFYTDKIMTLWNIFSSSIKYFFPARSHRSMRYLLTNMGFSGSDPYLKINHFSIFLIIAENRSNRSFYLIRSWDESSA